MGFLQDRKLSRSELDSIRGTFFSLLLPIKLIDTGLPRGGPKLKDEINGDIVIEQRIENFVAAVDETHPQELALVAEDCDDCKQQQPALR